MVYITGERETVESLCQREGFKGDPQDYLNQFKEFNPDLLSPADTYRARLPDYKPVNLVSDPFVDIPTRSPLIANINNYTTDEKRALRLLQDGGQDVPTQMALNDLMGEFHQEAIRFTKWLKKPAVSTGIKPINDGLTNKGLFKLIREAFNVGATVIINSEKFVFLDTLFKDMVERDILNKQLYLLETQTGDFQDLKELNAFKGAMQARVKQLTANIKQMLPKKLDSIIRKYVNPKVVNELISKRANCYSQKWAKTDIPLTTRLCFLEKTSYGFLQFTARGLKNIYTVGGKYMSYLDYGLVCYEAFFTETVNPTKTLVAGLGGIYAASQVVAAAGGTAALGGMVIAGLDIAMGGTGAAGATLLLCSPLVGWIVVIVVGVVAAGLITKYLKEESPGIYDIIESTFRGLGRGLGDLLDKIHKDYCEVYSYRFKNASDRAWWEVSWPD